MVNTHITMAVHFDKQEGKILTDFFHDDVEVFVEQLLTDLPKNKVPMAEFIKEEIISILESDPEFFFPENLEIYSDEEIQYECFGFYAYWWEGDILQCSFTVTSWTACLV